MGMREFNDTESAKSVGSVKDWLEQMSIVGDEEKERVDGAAPSTPLCKPQHFIQCEEVSPTDTAFSCDVVFDSPRSPPVSPSSPCPARHHDHGSYAETVASSLDEDENSCTRQELLADLEPLDDALLERQPASLPSDGSAILPNCNEQPNPISAQLATTGIDLNRRAPRFIWITSCLQCVLAGLPCSRTPPSCTRCTRKGNNDLCLLHRRRLRNEMYNANGDLNTAPVLLKTLGDNDEVAWQKKVELSSMLLALWSDIQDHKNWVLPINDGRLGDWKTCAFKLPRGHPGEGIGRTTYYELRLAEA